MTADPTLSTARPGHAGDTADAPPRRVLVLGANGRLGRAAVDAFAAAGWQVLAQLRRAPVSALPAGATAIAVPLSDTAALAAAAQGASAVLYAVNPPYMRWDAELLPLFDQGMAVARQLGACLLLPGNVYNFGAGMPALLDEATPQRPSTRKGAQRCAMEARLQALAADGLDSVVIRAGDFFGSGSGSWLDQVLVKSIAKGKLAYPGPLGIAHAWAYVPDLARAFVAVAGARDAAARHAAHRATCQVMHFAGHTATGHEMLTALDRAAAGLGLRPARGWRATGTLPWGLLRAIGLVHPLWRDLARMRYLWQVPHALAGTALQRAAGSLPTTPLVAALAQSLADLGLARGAAANRQPARAHAGP